MNARQFFDVWPHVVTAVARSRQSIAAALAAESVLYATALASHGPRVAAKAVVLLRAYQKEPRP